MDKSDVELLKDDVLFSDYGVLRQVTLRHRRFDGSWSHPQTREVFQRPNAAAVLPYDPARDSVLLVEQFRFGAHFGGCRSWQFEPMAGHIETGETALGVAHREALEEAGCTLGEMIPICRYLVSPGYATETVDVFCGRLTNPFNPGIFGVGDEDIRAKMMPFREAMAGLEAGQFENALAIISLQWLALHRDRVRAKWAGP